MRFDTHRTLSHNLLPMSIIETNTFVKTSLQRGVITQSSNTMTKINSKQTKKS